MFLERVLFRMDLFFMAEGGSWNFNRLTNGVGPDYS